MPRKIVKRDKAFWIALRKRYPCVYNYFRVTRSIHVVRDGRLLHKSWIEHGRRPDYAWWKRARTWRGYNWRKDVASVEEILDEAGKPAWLLTLHSKKDC